jgi:hypothetical protein
MTEPDLPTRTEGEGETLDLPQGMGGIAPGQVLGERYQVLELLGRGGMGEVWHAFDLKLRVEVALKALRQEFFESERRLELLRQEVRAAREVVSPNVCRIFDLIEIEGRELVSMEYMDGATVRLNSKPNLRLPRMTTRSIYAPAWVAQKKHSSGFAPRRSLTTSAANPSHEAPDWGWPWTSSLPRRLRRL